MPTQEDMDKLREDALATIKKLTEERDIWQARAFAMFWRLPDDTNLGELREEAEKAMIFVRT
jgi:uncharacterized protein with von Willebrand factor type A (vWA) domain